MSSTIPVFKAEQDAGLQHLIESNASIAYQTPILLDQECHEDIACSIKEEAHKGDGNYQTDPLTATPTAFPDFVKAAKDDDDIYHVYSILVSTSWNKNDDVFDKDEVWASKDTPKYKPTNLEHDEKQIVGGIIDNWAVDDNFNLIDENSESKDLPDRYHILVSSVIYRQWQDPDYHHRVLDLIEKIEAGNKYVSMECMFRGFDYAVVAPDGKNHILIRNDETAFLTQHLRSYGGTGAYQDHQVGRLLRNITFSGKGFVDKPANPDSIIFDKNKTFEFNTASISSKSSLFNPNGVILKVDNPNILNTQESYDMSNEILSDQIAELKASLESAQAENTTLADKLAEANVEKYEQNIEELNNQLKTSAEQIKSLTSELAASKSNAEEITSKFEVINASHDKLVSYVADMDAAEKARSRKASLIEAGLSDEEADAKVEIFADLSDEQFGIVTQTLADYSDKWKKNKKDKKDEDDDDETDSSVETADEEVEVEAKVDEEVLETVKAEETSSLSVASDAIVGSDDGIDVVRAGLQDWVSTVIINTKNSNSGE
tara:strand:+ start:756 stop:2393 length:1638 start_codon:yes stop_codon:yes gene_type:complete